MVSFPQSFIEILFSTLGWTMFFYFCRVALKDGE